jgi:hypothetical protein
MYSPAHVSCWSWKRTWHVGILFAKKHALPSGPWRVRCAHRTELRDDLSAPLPSTAGRVPTSRWVLVVLYGRHGWRVTAEQGAFAALFSPTRPSPTQMWRRSGAAGL